MNTHNAEASSSKGGKSSLPQHHHWHGVLDNALDAVGCTPLIRLQRIAREEGFKCNLMGKCEYLSAGGSVKDRIAKRMIEDAERKGLLIPGKSVVIEPTSGNTGIGLAMACAIKGYKCIITLPAKMSREKEVMMRALGAVIVRTPTEAAWDSPESHIGIAKLLRDTIPHAIILDQYSNPHNPLAHYYGTYPEVRSSLAESTFENKHISALFAGAGTGGTITGLARGIRDDEAEAGPSRKRARVVAIDPEGSILGGGDVVGNYEVEGIGYDFFPEVLDPKPPLIDDWVKTNDEMAFAACKRLIMSEGLFVGGSSGSALSGALKYLHTTPAGRALAADPDANVVVIFPDGVRNYISKPWFLDVAESEAIADLKVVVKDVVGRPLDQPGAKAVQHKARDKGVELEQGEGVDGRESLECSKSGEGELVGGGGEYKQIHGNEEVHVNGEVQGQEGLVSDVLAKLGIKAQ